MLAVLFIIAFTLLVPQRVAAADVPVPMTPIDERQVKVGGALGDRITVTVNNNLLKVDIDNDFILPFRKKNAVGAYIGMGKMIETVARLSAYTGDERVRAVRNKIVDALIQSQDSDGYIGALKPENRVWKVWDTQEISYIIYGLLIDYDLSGEKRGLDAAKRLGDYLINARLEDARNGNARRSALKFNHEIGIEMAAVSLFKHTRDQRYLDFCLNYMNMPEWNKEIFLGRNLKLDGHNYSYLNKCFAQVQLDRLHPDTRLLRASHRVLDFLTKEDGMVITGSSGDQELWHNTQEGTANLAETCTTTYLVRWLNELFQLEANPLYGDMMERIIYNSLFGAQSPDGRRICYFLPFEGRRRYFPTDTYCCPNSYRKIISELPAMIYFQWDGGAVVNLYTASTATVPLPAGGNVTLTQATDYPRSGKVSVTISPSKPASFPVRFRIPAWAREATVSVNGETPRKALPGLLAVRRQWRPGDRVALILPMSPRLVKGRQAQAGRAAVMCGPRVFGLKRENIGKEREDMNSIDLNADYMDLRTIFIDPSSLEGPVDDTIRIRAWSPGRFAHRKTDLGLTLVEHADPATEAIYFKLPNPRDPALIDDELMLKK